MKSLRVLIGTLLIVVGVAAMLFFVVVPLFLPSFSDSPFIENTFQSMFCKSGETLSGQRRFYHTSPGSNSMSLELTCSNDDSQARDVTALPILYGVFGFLIPFFIGLFLIIGSSSRRQQTLMSQSFVTYAGQGQPYSYSTMGYDINIDEHGQVVVKTPDGKVLTGHPSQFGVTSSLTDRLKDLKSALDSGLITESEYETKRQEILRNM